MLQDPGEIALDGPPVRGRGIAGRDDAGLKFMPECGMVAGAVAEGEEFADPAIGEDHGALVDGEGLRPVGELDAGGWMDGGTGARGAGPARGDGVPVDEAPGGDAEEEFQQSTPDGGWQGRWVVPEDDGHEFLEGDRFRGAVDRGGEGDLSREEFGGEGGAGRGGESGGAGLGDRSGGFEVGQAGSDEAGAQPGDVRGFEELMVIPGEEALVESSGEGEVQELFPFDPGPGA